MSGFIPLSLSVVTSCYISAYYHLQFCLFNIKINRITWVVAFLMVRGNHFSFGLLKAVSVLLKRYCVSEEWWKETHRKVFESLSQALWSQGNAWNCWQNKAIPSRVITAKNRHCKFPTTKRIWEVFFHFAPWPTTLKYWETLRLFKTFSEKETSPLKERRWKVKFFKTNGS